MDLKGSKMYSNSMEEEYPLPFFNNFDPPDNRDDRKYLDFENSQEIFESESNNQLAHYEEVNWIEVLEDRVDRFVSSMKIKYDSKKSLFKIVGHTEDFLHASSALFFKRKFCGFKRTKVASIQRKFRVGSILDETDFNIFNIRSRKLIIGRMKTRISYLCIPFQVAELEQVSKQGLYKYHPSRKLYPDNFSKVFPDKVKNISSGISLNDIINIKSFKNEYNNIVPRKIARVDAVEKRRYPDYLMLSYIMYNSKIYLLWRRSKDIHHIQGLSYEEVDLDTKRVWTFKHQAFTSFVVRTKDKIITRSNIVDLFNIGSFKGINIDIFAYYTYGNQRIKFNFAKKKFAQLDWRRPVLF
jgi:hypothetical protein